MLRWTSCLLLVWAGTHAIPTYAHGGGLDKYGCHNDRKRGGYHCHRGVSAPPSPSRYVRPAPAPSADSYERRPDTNASNFQSADTPEWMRSFNDAPQMPAPQRNVDGSAGSIRLLCKGYQRGGSRSTAVTDGNSVLLILDLENQTLTIDTPHQPLRGPLQVSEQYYLAKASGAYGHRYAISLDRYTPNVVIAREQGNETVTEFSGSCATASPKI